MYFIQVAQGRRLGHELPYALIKGAVDEYIGAGAIGGWSGFFITLVVLQTIYFFFWFKQALWGWLVFWFYGKRRMAEQLENSFIDSRFPPPSRYATDLDDYFSEISNNEGLDPTTRVKAAHELGTLNGLKIARRFSMILQINSAAETALKRYARLGERFAQ